MPPFGDGGTFRVLGCAFVVFLGDSRFWRFASLLLCGGGWCLSGVRVKWYFPFNGVLGVSF